MKYLIKPHPKGIAIITWEMDIDYPFDDKEHELEGPFYFLWVDVYNQKLELVDENGLGGIQISCLQDSDEFAREINQAYQYHFLEV